MTRIPSPRSQRRARIEIIPLIDIVFFLLATFVMVSLSMVKNQGIAVNLPAAATGAPQSRAQSATLSLAADGQLFFDKRLVDPSQLETTLRQWAAEKADPRLFLSADTKAEFGRAIALLDTVRKLGITKVSVQTQPAPASPALPEGGPPPAP